MDELTYELKIDFQRGSKEPSRIFHSMAELIESFHTLDSDLLTSFDVKFEVVQILEDIQTGSLKSIVKNILNALDDEALKAGEFNKAVGRFIHNSKYQIIEWCNKNEKVENPEKIEEIVKSIHGLAETTDIRSIPYYKPISVDKFIKDLQMIKSSLAFLQRKDSAFYTAFGEIISFNKEFEFSEELLSSIFSKNIITNESQVILKIKKPDYLGESKWEFKHGTHPIKANIDDKEWLNTFQTRKQEIKPGDSLKVRLETKVHYGSENEVVFIEYKIIKVYEIISGGDYQQIEFPANDG